MTYIQAINLNKSYKSGNHVITANKNISFTINKGELVVILGASGAGKSTLLNLLGGMDTVDTGTLLVDGQNIAHYTDKSLTRYRRLDVGFVFQFYNLVPNLTAKENVELATELVEKPQDPVSVLHAVGLEKRLDNFPAQLSGGEQQRVSIARAIAKNPKLLLCDEPTGALDYQTGKSILALLQTLAHEHNMTIIIVTHNAAIAPIADKVIKMHDATIVSITENDSPTSIQNLSY